MSLQAHGPQPLPVFCAMSIRRFMDGSPSCVLAMGVVLRRAVTQRRQALVWRAIRSWIEAPITTKGVVAGSRPRRPHLVAGADGRNEPGRGGHPDPVLTAGPYA